VKAPRPSQAALPALLEACAAGEPAARSAFQETYGEDIYNFPVKIYRVPAEKAADFYVYAFERDRIFTRLRTFEGRNNIQFRTFLAYYVLKSLFLEWRRGQRELDTVSLAESVGGAPGGHALEDVLAADLPADVASPETAPDAVAALWAGLTAEERLDMKLLSLLEHDLDPDDVRLLARTSGRSIQATLALVADVQAGLQRRDEKLAEMRDALDAAWGWIVLRQRELQETEEKIRLLGTEEGPERRRLLEHRERLQQAVAKRLRQRERILREIGQFKVTTPYKDIARLLGLSVGTVCSRIFRLRRRLAQAAGAPEPREAQA
jgi:RNA polymerase sigma factor (sigma-70 family)